MSDNSFFKQTPLYKEFVILDLIEKEKKITQRVMSKFLEISVSMVNSYLANFEQEGYIRRKYVNSKTVTYHITHKGMDRKKILNIGFLKASQKIYYLAKENITTFLDQIVNKGFKSIILYGAGEVAEILLQTIKTDYNSKLVVLAVVDDDTEKQGKYFLGEIIRNSEVIRESSFDGILISSYTNQNIIETKLKYANIDNNKIIKFFY